ncbi:MAG: hypothetical protein NVS9B4_23950 [Candidatus Acidiferrum sp.]
MASELAANRETIESEKAGTTETGLVVIYVGGSGTMHPLKSETLRPPRA